MLSNSTSFDPEKAWEEFYKKFPVTSALPPEVKKWYELRLSPEENKKWEIARQNTKGNKLEEKDISFIQQAWRQKRAKDTLVKVNVKGNHSSDFVELVHNQPIKKSLNQEKLTRLWDALNQARLEDAIFQDHDLPHLVMSLFASVKITQQQITTLLERHQIFNVDRRQAVNSKIAILDAKGELTAEANKMLAYSENHCRFISGQVREVKHCLLTPDQIQEFKLLISKLPLSEQIFYTTIPIENFYDYVSGNTLRRVPLEERLVKLGSIYQYRTEEGYPVNLHLSAGARDALGMTRFGLDNYVKMTPVLSKKSMTDIEQGLRQKKRFGDIYYPETLSANVPPWGKVTEFASTAHDNFHAEMLSAFSKELQDALLHMVQVVRGVTSFKWSKEMWEWIDAEYGNTIVYTMPCDKSYGERLKKNQLTVPDITALFCEIVLHAKEDDVGEKKHYLFLDHKNYLTIVSILILLDIIKNEDAWKENYKIDLNTLPDNNPIKKFYLEIKSFYQYLQHDDPQIQLLKVLLHFGEFRITNMCDIWLCNTTNSKKYRDSSEESLCIYRQDEDTFVYKMGGVIHKIDNVPEPLKHASLEGNHRCVDDAIRIPILQETSQKGHTRQVDEKAFESISRLISDSKDMLAPEITFEKIKETPSDEAEYCSLKNHIRFLFNNQDCKFISSHNIYKIIAEKILGDSCSYTDVDNFIEAIEDLNYSRDDAIDYVKNKRADSVATLTR